MCGIAGALSLKKYDLHSVTPMGKAIVHRGPDAFGEWRDDEAGIALVHARLSIIDISTAGNQPMRSSCGRYVICYNGEIYNHLDLRKRLSKSGEFIAWRGGSDTETLLACISAWGLDKALAEAVGMFAFGLWDYKDRKLVLARDRMGEKPLYWGWIGETLVFASELKALKNYPSANLSISKKAICLLLRHNYIPAPHSVYENIYKLPPGSSITFDTNKNPKYASPQKYWSIEGAVEDGMSSPFLGSAAEAAEALERHLIESIEGQMLSDVPLGAFLSGGVDSSLVASLMQRISHQPIKTFSIGFEQEDYDEAQYAAQVARILGTSHSELYISTDDLLKDVDRLPEIYCEPFADSSQLPMLAVSRLAKRQVTVALSGDGGDELFGGYNTYSMASTLWRFIAPLPYPLRLLVWKVISSMPAQMTPEKFKKLMMVIKANDQYDMYRRLVSQWGEPESVLISKSFSSESPMVLDGRIENELDFKSWMMCVDSKVYMPDDILVKVDRASMANSLEVRVPMLDHRVVEFAWSLPNNYKFNGSDKKWLLKQVLYKYVPKEIMNRKKKGFSVPLGSWLRGPLREWASNLLSENRLVGDGYFEPAEVQRVWQNHLRGKGDYSRKLWCILMFQAWLHND